MKKIIVNQKKCIGCGTCTVIAPKIFKLRKNGKATVINQDTKSVKKLMKLFLSVLVVQLDNLLSSLINFQFPYWEYLSVHGRAGQRHFVSSPLSLISDGAKNFAGSEAAEGDRAKAEAAAAIPFPLKPLPR